MNNFEVNYDSNSTNSTNSTNSSNSSSDNNVVTFADDFKKYVIYDAEDNNNNEFNTNPKKLLFKNKQTEQTVKQIEQADDEKIEQAVKQIEQDENVVEVKSEIEEQDEEHVLKQILKNISKKNNLYAGGGFSSLSVNTKFWILLIVATLEIVFITVTMFISLIIPFSTLLFSFLGVSTTIVIFSIIFIVLAVLTNLIFSYWSFGFIALILNWIVGLVGIFLMTGNLGIVSIIITNAVIGSLTILTTIFIRLTRERSLEAKNLLPVLFVCYVLLEISTTALHSSALFYPRIFGCLMVYTLYIDELTDVLAGSQGKYLEDNLWKMLLNITCVILGFYYLLINSLFILKNEGLYIIYVTPPLSWL